MKPRTAGSGLVAIMIACLALPAHADGVLTIKEYSLEGVYGEDNCTDDAMRAIVCARDYAIKIPYIETGDPAADEQLNQAIFSKTHMRLSIKNIQEIKKQKKLERGIYESESASYHISYYQYPLLSLVMKTGGCHSPQSCNADETTGIILDVETRQFIEATHLLNPGTLNALNKELSLKINQKLAENESITSNTIEEYFKSDPATQKIRNQCIGCSLFLSAAGMHFVFPAGGQNPPYMIKIPETYWSQGFVNHYAFSNLLEE